MSDVFISYSRKNGDFARRLVDGLQANGRDSWIDWEDIPRTAEWWQEIQDGIDSADIFICILTPESQSSTTCTLEVAHAFEQSKRIIPVVHIQPDPAVSFGRIAAAPIDDVLEKMLAGRDLLLLARENWRRLGEINWVFFRDEDDFDAALKQLIETLETDLPYVKTHTRLLIRAKEWEKTPDDDSLLLSGESLRSAENWLEFNADKNPPPTDLHRRYIKASKAKREQDVIAEAERHARELTLAREAAKSALRAETAEKARATRFRNAARFAGVLLAIALILLVLAGVTTVNTRSTLATVEFNATVGYLQSDYNLAFLNYFGVLPTQVYPPPIGTLAPATVIAQATQWAATTTWTPEAPKDFGDGVPMVHVPAGCFWMGSGNDGNSDELPVNRVCLAEFWIDQTEVTQGDFARLRGQQAKPSAFAGARRPVEYITWLEARAFCEQRLGARLPSEAEWEYAAGGPESRIYPWGNAWDASKVVGNRGIDQGTADVGSIPAGASWVGALDMAGNVWEWTSSLYQAYPYNAKDGREDPNNSTGVHVLRGSSWSNIVAAPSLFRSSYRYYYLPYTGFDIGFRCARSA